MRILKKHYGSLGEEVEDYLVRSYLKCTCKERRILKFYKVMN